VKTLVATVRYEVKLITLQ
jgi:hypothetical protein